VQNAPTLSSTQAVATNIYLPCGKPSEITVMNHLLPLETLWKRTSMVCIFCMTVLHQGQMHLPCFVQT
jgi:hypothetical protein